MIAEGGAAIGVDLELVLAPGVLGREVAHWSMKDSSLPFPRSRVHSTIHSHTHPYMTSFPGAMCWRTVNSSLHFCCVLGPHLGVIRGYSWLCI